MGCARTFSAKTPWGWVAHLQTETPYPLGEPRDVRSPLLVLHGRPAGHPAALGRGYGGEDGVFSAQDLAGFRLVFDPRFHAYHDHQRETFGGLRKQQRRLA